jgi:hypothetical protein
MGIARALFDSVALTARGTVVMTSLGNDGVCQLCRYAQGPTISPFVQGLVQLRTHDTVPTHAVLRWVLLSTLNVDNDAGSM